MSNKDNFKNIFDALNAHHDTYRIENWGLDTIINMGGGLPIMKSPAQILRDTTGDLTTANNLARHHIQHTFSDDILLTRYGAYFIAKNLSNSWESEFDVSGYRFEMACLLNPDAEFDKIMGTYHTINRLMEEDIFFRERKIFNDIVIRHAMLDETDRRDAWKQMNFSFFSPQFVKENYSFLNMAKDGISNYMDADILREKTKAIKAVWTQINSGKEKRPQNRKEKIELRNIARDLIIQETEKGRTNLINRGIIPEKQILSHDTKNIWAKHQAQERAFVKNYMNRGFGK